MAVFVHHNMACKTTPKSHLVYNTFLYIYIFSCFVLCSEMCKQHQQRQIIILTLFHCEKCL
jgi:hypothetical protein